MAVTGWSSANYLRRTSQVINTYPFLVSGWVNRDTTAVNRVMCQVGNTGADMRVALARVGSPNTLSASCYDGVFAGANGSVALTLSTWGHYGGEFISTASRAILINGADRQGNTTTVSPTASDSIYVGRAQQTADAMGAAEGLAEISLWNCAGMSTANMDSLCVKLKNGENPLNITVEAAQPWTGDLVAYWPLTSSTDLNDASGNGHHLSMVGTITNFASHPTIDAPPAGGASLTPTIGAASITGIAGRMGYGIITPTMTKI